MKAPAREGELRVWFECPRRACAEFFISYYTRVGGGPNFTFRKSCPATPDATKFSENIASLSPSFVEIYNQAVAAEAANLQHLTGVGLRKALEFLVKDFAKAEHPGDGQEIEKALLGTCINRYLDDQNVKECAKRAAWLGNDETHYIRKWGDQDVRNLKTLIALTATAIENVLLTRKFFNDMKEPA